MNEDSSKFAIGPSVEFMTFVPELKLIYYAEKGSNVLKVPGKKGALSSAIGRIVLASFSSLHVVSGDVLRYVTPTLSVQGKCDRATK